MDYMCVPQNLDNFVFSDKYNATVNTATSDATIMSQTSATSAMCPKSVRSLSTSRTATVDDMKNLAAESIASYVARSHLVLVLAPRIEKGEVNRSMRRLYSKGTTIKRKKCTDRRRRRRQIPSSSAVQYYTRDTSFTTWRRRGWCITEMYAAVLAENPKDVLVVQDDNTVPYWLPSDDAFMMTPIGHATWTCCAVDHSFQSGKRLCDRLLVKRAISRQVLALSNKHFRADKPHRARLAKSTLRWFLRGTEDARGACVWAVVDDVPLPREIDRLKAFLRWTSDGTCPVPTNIVVRIMFPIECYVRKYTNPHAPRSHPRPQTMPASDIQGRQVGFTLLRYAIINDCVEAVREIVANIVTDSSLSPQRRMEALEGTETTFDDVKRLVPIVSMSRITYTSNLHVAMVFGSHEIVATLLKHGARPHIHGRLCTNDAFVSAALLSRIDNVNFWLDRFPHYDMEITVRFYSTLSHCGHYHVSCASPSTHARARRNSTCSVTPSFSLSFGIQDTTNFPS